jgi:hypothetical protein
VTLSILSHLIFEKEVSEKRFTKLTPRQKKTDENKNWLQSFSGHLCNGQRPQVGLPDGICILNPKIPIWVIFGGFPNGRCW